MALLLRGRGLLVLHLERNIVRFWGVTRRGRWETICLLPQSENLRAGEEDSLEGDSHPAEEGSLEEGSRPAGGDSNHCDVRGALAQGPVFESRATLGAMPAEQKPHGGALGPSRRRKGGKTTNPC